MTMESPHCSTKDSAFQSDTSQTDSTERKHNLGIARQALIDEFHALLDDTERLLEHTADLGGIQADEIRASINERLTRAKGILGESQEQLSEQGQELLKTAEEHVHAHPWRSVGIAAGAGLLLGLLLGRR